MSPGSLRRLAKRCLGAFPGDRLRLGQCHTAFILSIYATQTHAFSRVVLSLTASVFAQSDKTDDFINAEMKRQREFPAFLSPSSRTVTSSKAAGYGVANIFAKDFRQTRNRLQDRICQQAIHRHWRLTASREQRRFAEPSARFLENAIENCVTDSV